MDYQDEVLNLVLSTGIGDFWREIDKRCYDRGFVDSSKE
jgi:hypothetical protein